MPDWLPRMTTTTSVTTRRFTPGRARGCGCPEPWRDDETCLRCGHRVPPATRSAPRTRRSVIDGNPWTPAGIVRALRAYEFFVGRAPTTTDWSFEEDAGWPSATTVVRLFGSFEAALAAARVSPAGSPS
jgi:hypothetical protein